MDLPVRWAWAIARGNEGGINRDLARIPVENIGDSGPRIEEEYVLDEHGIVAVSIKHLDAGFFSSAPSVVRRKSRRKQRRP